MEVKFEIKAKAENIRVWYNLSGHQLTSRVLFKAKVRVAVLMPFHGP